MSRRISSPELIGRAAALSSLHAALDEARAGQGRVVLVEGDAGLGKTRLVEHFVSQAGEARVLAGGGIPLAADVPYAPVIEIFRALAALYPPARDSLLPREPAAGADRADLAGPGRLLSMAAEALRALAEQHPVLVVIEDLHWADTSTRDLVSYLAPDPAPGPGPAAGHRPRRGAGPGPPGRRAGRRAGPGAAGRAAGAAPAGPRRGRRPDTGDHRDRTAARQGGPDTGSRCGQPILHRGAPRGRRRCGCRAGDGARGAANPSRPAAAARPPGPASRGSTGPQRSA